MAIFLQNETAIQNQVNIFFIKTDFFYIYVSAFRTQELKFKNVVRYLFGCHKISQDLAEKVPKYSCVNQKIPHHLGLKKLTKNFY